MLYRLRRRDGSADPYSYGVLVEADGSTAQLSPADFILDVKNTWQSPDKKAIYPSGWRLRIPSGALDLDVEPLLEDQEWRHAFRYWEGAVSVRGRRGPRAVTGVGYAELTGLRNSRFLKDVPGTMRLRARARKGPCIRRGDGFQG